MAQDMNANNDNEQPTERPVEPTADAAIEPTGETSVQPAADANVEPSNAPKAQSSNNEVEESEGGKKWFVVHAMSGCEMRVKRALEERIALHGMEANFGEILVPSEEVMELRGGQKKLIERKIFPGYVLVEMVMTDETWHFVRHVPNVLGFIGGHSGKAAPISRKDVDNIMHRVEEGAQAPKPKVLFEAGEVVRVVDGPFADFNGVVEEVNYEKNRLRVAVLIFGRSTPVELEFSQVEKG